MKLPVWLLALWPACLGASLDTARAQTPAPTVQSAGRVSGAVTCEDTGRAGRFAGIVLIPDRLDARPPSGAQLPGRNDGFAPPLGPPGSIAGFAQGAPVGSPLATVADLAGAFTLANVPPGTYFVVVQLAGYRSPLNALTRSQRQRIDTATLSLLARQATRVSVQAGATAHVTVRLERGATLAGTISYADGTPASGVVPALLRRAADGQWEEIPVPAPLMAGATDDQGTFRFYGLPAGQYAVRATLPVTQLLAGIGPRDVALHTDTADELQIYSGGALHAADVQPIELAGHETRDIHLVFPLHGLRVISGRVVALADGHGINAGFVQLLQPDSGTPLRTAALNADGRFVMRYVPDGNYSLKVLDAADVTRPTRGILAVLLEGCHEVHAYEDAQQPLSLRADATGLLIKLALGPPPATGPAAPPPPASLCLPGIVPPAGALSSRQDDSRPR